MSDHLEFEADLYDMDLEYYSSPNDLGNSDWPTDQHDLDRQHTIRNWDFEVVDKLFKDIPFELALECLSFLTIGEIHELTALVSLSVPQSDRLFKFVCRLATNCKRDWTKTNLRF